MIVQKAVNMARMMDVPVMGLIENYSYLSCPDCGKRIAVFGESHVEEIASKHGLPVLARLPIDQKLAELCDRGEVERYQSDAIGDTLAAIEAL